MVRLTSSRQPCFNSEGATVMLAVLRTADFLVFKKTLSVMYFDRYFCYTGATDIGDRLIDLTRLDQVVQCRYRRLIPKCPDTVRNISSIEVPGCRAESRTMDPWNLVRRPTQQNCVRVKAADRRVLLSAAFDTVAVRPHSDKAAVWDISPGHFFPRTYFPRQCPIPHNFHPYLGHSPGC